MQWMLQKMTIDGKEYKLTDENPFIKFENDGKVSGFASINRFFGSIKIDNQGRVKWTAPFGSTRMAGPPELMEQENSFLNALQKTESFSIERIYLYIQTSDGQTELTFYVPVK
jgi:heat shock protein HslJ